MVSNESLNLNDTIAKGNFIGDVRSGDQSSDIPVTVYGTSQVDVSQWELTMVSQRVTLLRFIRHLVPE